ncbi:hypothetical protein AC1031_007995 [Aphanomyces cochlioides]|nr:hypothetical protein AC1031_007995 [Aphanomyces cochlioides]
MSSYHARSAAGYAIKWRPSTTASALTSQLVSSLSVLPTVKFSRLDAADVFRIHVATVENDVPMKIWMENQRSKDQWFDLLGVRYALIVRRECAVEDIADHAPRGAKDMLPSSVVVASLMSALTAKSKDGGGASKERKVDLSAGSDESLNLVLTMTGFERLTVEYSFNLIRLNVDATQVLEAQIRDLVEDVAQLKATNALAKFQSFQLANLRAELSMLTSREESICSPEGVYSKYGRSSIVQSRRME